MEMSIQEFEGKNEQEAINQAIEALGLKREEIDVEIVEAKKASFLFGGGKVRIRVHLDEEKPREDSQSPVNDFESKMCAFLEGLLERIGLPGKVRVAFREDRKLGFNLMTREAGILIGKRGQTLEAIQLISNIVAGRLDRGNIRVIVDTQNYRSRREKSLIRMAQQAAEQVRRSGQPQLLEAMNPFERRLVHTALSDLEDIETNSEGEGLFKRVRISSASQQARRRRG
jgi:spoIIIJ-associated protein